MRPFAFLLIAAFALAVSPRESFAQANTMGQWSPVFFVGEQATDCGLLRGNGDSTVVLFYDNTNTARIVLPNLGAPGSWPIVRVPYAGPPLHEGGHTILPDGRYAIFGGADGVRFTSSYTATFDAKQYANPATRGWVADDPMNFMRIACTATPLGDGTVLVTSGVDHYSLPLFGGENATGAVGDLKELAARYTPTERWASRPNPSPPSPRHGARGAFGFSQLVLYGGRDAAGARSDAWFVQRRQANSGVRWIWSQVLLTFDSPVPPARSDHGVVAQLASCDSLCDTLWTFGGRGTSGQALGDVWRMVFGSRAQSRYRWEPVTPAGDGPGARWGHTAVYDPGPPGAAATGTYPRMLVFGGRDSTGALCDNRVWSLTLRPPFRWSALTSATPTPAPRTGHVAVLDIRNRNPNTKPKRMTIFGGEGAGGVLGDTWFLFRGNSSAADTTYSWTLNTASPVNPPARTRATVAYDDIFDRIVVWGGDSDGGDASTGVQSDLWVLGPSLDPAYPALWTSIGQDSTPVARAGATMLWWPRGSVTVMTPERFDPAAPAGSRYSRLDWASFYDQWLYPYMYLTPQGKVLYAAITDSCRLLDPDPLSPTRGWGAPLGSLFSGASSVALRPNAFLKSGGDQFPALTGVIEFDSLGATTGWQPVNGMLPRVDHSTLMLPDGRALVTGGDAVRKNTALAQKQPQIFDPVSRTWSGPLATAPAIRGYHSTAVLLPDARVLTWGGFINNTPRDSAEVYSPPYLFADAAGTPAVRPVITAVQSEVAYDQAFVVCACDAPAVRSMSLIRPGSPTHAFDQNARFVPLEFEPDPSGTWFVVRAPKDGNVAPPGDYMLFVVDTLGVPSVARWVRVRPGPEAPSVSCPQPCVASAPEGRALAFALERPRPNPSFGGAQLAFTLPAAARVTLDVLDVQGRLVRRVHDGALAAGPHARTWDGRNARGDRVGAGVYFARLAHADGRVVTARLVRLP